jgi:hypothetical protein
MSCVRNVVLVSVALGVACGGSASNNNLTSGDGSAPMGVDGSLASSGSSSGSGGGSGSGATSDDSGLMEVDDSGYIAIPGGDDGGEDDGGSSSSGSSGAGSSSSGGASGAMEAGVGVITPPHGTDGGAMQIECGASPCDSTTQVCCASVLGRTCTTAAACDGDVLACSGTNSCASGVCCELVADAGHTIRTKCETECPAGVPQLCTTNTDCTKVDQYCHKYGSYGVCERTLPAATHDQ